jgi:hypothetical protein
MSKRYCYMSEKLQLSTIEFYFAFGCLVLDYYSFLHPFNFRPRTVSIELAILNSQTEQVGLEMWWLIWISTRTRSIVIDVFVF